MQSLCAPRLLASFRRANWGHPNTANVARVRALSGKSVSPLVLKYDTPAGPLYIGNDGPIQRLKPGNGGLRVWQYASEEDAIKECAALSTGMSSKHEVFNTGFSGAKLVLNAQNPSKAVNKATLSAVAAALHELDGAVYTGCDLNTSLADMEALFDMCPYVLASLGVSTDANVATGYGVFGAIQGALEADGGVAGKSFFVKGTGKVGATVARLLVQAGAARVSTADLVPGHADIAGCVNVSGREWADVAADVFVPCSVSGFITEDVAARLSVRYIIGASNVPFRSAAALAAAEARGIVFVPEAVSSAGAVIVDSIEMYSPAAYRAERPHMNYAFVRAMAREKARELMREAAARGLPASAAVKHVKADPAGPPLGARFTEWKAAATHATDVVVVGGGMAGTAAAYYLQRDVPLMKTTVLEARELATAAGGSYGESRMYRRMYSSEYFSKMQAIALDLWREVEEDVGEQLLTRNGLVFYGEVDTGETVEGSVPGAKQVMDKLGIPNEYFDSAEKINARWPVLDAKPGYEGVYEETAGSANSGAACRAFMRRAIDNGAELYEGEAAEDIAVLGRNSVQVVTSEGRVFVARRAVLAPGSWAHEVVSLVGRPLDLEVHNVHWGHYEVEPSMLKEYPQWFCFKKHEPGSWDGGLYYGFPAQSDAPVIKVGIDFTPDDPRFITPTMAGFNREPHPDIVKLIDDFVFSNLKGVKRRVDMTCSPYSMSKDSFFVLDRLPEHPEIVLYTGGSGRDFKFAPLLGRCIVDLVLGRKPSYDVTPFSATREAVRPKD